MTAQARFSKTSLKANLTQWMASPFYCTGTGVITDDPQDFVDSLNEGKTSCLQNLTAFVATCPRFSKAVWRARLRFVFETLEGAWGFTENSGYAQVRGSSAERVRAYAAFDTCRRLWDDLA